MSKWPQYDAWRHAAGPDKWPTGTQKRREQRRRAKERQQPKWVPVSADTNRVATKVDRGAATGIPKADNVEAAVGFTAIAIS